MVDERRERQAYWDEQRREGKLEVDINIGIGQDRPPPEEIWADEVDDEEIEDEFEEDIVDDIEEDIEDDVEEAQNE